MPEERKNWTDYQLSAAKAEYAQLPVRKNLEIIEPEKKMLTMSDGNRLYTYCRRPVGPGPFPAIIMRSCYPEQEPVLQLHAAEFSRRGYAFVFQLCRGTGKSEGQWLPNVNERSDGKETIAWLAAQSWAGSIGYWGSSYLALTGWAIGDLLPDKVKTLYLTHYGTDRFTSAYQCGMFRQDVLTAWAMNNTGHQVTADYEQSLNYRPHIHVDEALWGGKLDWYRDWISNTSRQDNYWQTGFWKELQDMPARIRVPVCLGEGWYDHHLGSALRGWEELSGESKKHSVLRIGAWNHGFAPCVKGIEPQNLNNSDVKNALNWFDSLLQRNEKPDGRVEAYQINADRWLTLPVYPFSAASKKTLYLDSRNSSGRAFRLTEQPHDGSAATEYDYDPENPVRSHGAEAMLNTMRSVGSLEQPECGYRDDVVSFVSEPLDSDLAILGKIQVVLQVSSTAEDTAFSAKLIEIKADGRAYNIRSGITTLAYRQCSGQSRTDYVPATIVEARIECWDIAWLIKTGSRLRLDLSSSDFPQYAVHSNFTGIWSLQDKTRIARQSIYSGSAYPSKIILPVDE